MRLAVCLLFSILLLSGGASARAGMADYSDRGKIDFDTLIELLNPDGTWAKVDGLWAYTPLDHAAPYTSGRWLYTEYGWYWKGTKPHSWATEHYGFWKVGDDHVWSWFPGPTWLPQIVELRSTATHIGWRSAEVDSDGSFVEDPADRYAKVDEWSFVTRAQFCGAITPAVIADPATASKLLENASTAMHSYVTYRAITRPGPHPADFFALARASGMFPPQLSGAPAPEAPESAAPRASAPAKAGPGASTNATTSATNAATTDGDPPLQDDNGAPADMRQVPYWITMSLPSYWTPTPASAQPNQAYIYRPDIYQDQDGIERRITLWLNPKARSSLADLRDVLTRPKPAPASTPGPAGSPAVPATPAASSRGPFQSPFDDSYHGGVQPTPAPNSSTKNPGKPAPSGLSGSSTNDTPSPAP